MTAAAAAKLLGRLALSWLTVVAAAFVLLRLMPSDPVEVFLAHVNIRSGPEIVAAYRAQWGLDDSLAAQFLRWLGGFVTFDWGVSFETGRPVAADFAARLPYSAAIGFGGMVFAVTGGFALGFFAANRPGGLADALSRGLAVAGQALPAFAVGLILLWVLGVQLRWIDAFGGGPVERSPSAHASSSGSSRSVRCPDLTRAGFVEVKRSGYYRTALAKGGSQAGALWHHGSAAGVLTLIAGLARYRAAPWGARPRQELAATFHRCPARSSNRSLVRDHLPAEDPGPRSALQGPSRGRSGVLRLPSSRGADW